MTFANLLLWVGAMAFVWWVGRRVPLAGVRRWLVLGVRLMAVTAACFALWGWTHRVVRDEPQHVLYLVDVSTSMDAQQHAWVARRIASLDVRRPTLVDRALMVFAEEPQLVWPFDHAPLDDPIAIATMLGDVSIRRDHTDLEAALLAARGVIPAGEPGRVILFTDGRETAGNVTAILPQIRHLGLSVFPERVPTFADARTAWETLIVPPAVARGSPVGVQLVLNSAADRPKMGQVTVDLDGVTVAQQRVRVQPGWQVVTVSVPAVQQGTMAFEVTLEIPDEGLRERRRAYTEVEGPPHILFVKPQSTTLPRLGSALKRRGMELSVVRLHELPTRADDLLDYDAVLLFNIPKSQVTPTQVEALREYLERLGGGLAVVGLGGQLDREVATSAALDALLPVTYDAKGLQESQRRVCMIMLIDRSASMLGPRLKATKQAAVELVNQLAAEDLVGIFAFDTKPYVVVEVQRAGGVGLGLIDKLVKLRSSGGTDIYPALEIARSRLAQTDATVKHVILLSDGNTPWNRELYTQLAASFVQEDISISTIGIGAAFLNTDYLQWIAGSTGGSFYQLRSLDELPKLIAQDTQEALGNLPFTEGYYRPKPTATSMWGGETGMLPVVRGYLTTTAKPGAEVEVTVSAGEQPDPLVARWLVGQGRVVVFSSDADLRWSPEWIRWPGFEGWWSQVMRWVIRPRLTEELFVRVDQSGATPRLVIEGLLTDPKGTLSAPADPTPRTLSLIRTGPWRWEAPLDGVASGWHELTIESRQDALPTFVKRWVQIGTAPALEELIGQPPRELLLRDVARMTAGLYNVPDHAFVPPTAPVETHESTLVWWLPLVMLLFLVDIALRGSTML